MAGSLLVVEGRDDMTALTEILQREMSLQTIPHNQVESLHPPHIPFFREARYFRRSQDDHWCVVLNGQDCDRAAIKTREELEESLLADEDRFHCIGLVFDPDRDDPVAVQNWLQTHVLAPLRDHPQAFRIEALEWRYQLKHSGTVVDFIP